jgi:DNA invertase Pin-like site-specific DNA recombinase
LSPFTDGEKAKKRCAIYAQGSTQDQNLTMQIEELRRYAAARGWAVAGEFVDRGESGAKEQRPRLEALMLAAAPGQDSVISRLSCSRAG